MIVQETLLKLKRAIKVHVQFGPIDPAGVLVLLSLTVVFNPETGLVSVVQRKIVRDLQLTNNNAIYNLVQSLDQ